MTTRDQQRVEFRLLQVVLSPIGDERITLLLLHWDGHLLRVATGVPQMPRIPCNIAQLKSAVKRVGRAAMRAKRPLSGLLSDLYPVPAGLGSAFPYWTHVQIGHTKDPEAHFDELRSHFAMKRFHLAKRKGVKRKRCPSLSTPPP
jgi:hypothetical protein